MEKCIRQISKALAALLIFSIISFTLSSQTIPYKNKIRFVLWSNVDAYPGLKTDDSNDSTPSAYSENNIFNFAINSIRDIGPYLVNGMVYGWSFSYTPYDKTRGVEEQLKIEPLISQKVVEKGVTYSFPWVENNIFNCWCEYERAPYEVQEYERWAVIQNPVIHGIGYGNLADGFEGIKAAAADALKNALRTYYRNVIKNKPKEITGKVLIKTAPLIGVDAGRYMINLDFFLERGKIIEYKVF